MNLDWMADAECAGHADLFFGPEDEGPLQRAIRERAAKRVCGWCEVTAECRVYAESLPADQREHGVFGGMAEIDRQREIRRRAAMRRRGVAA